MRRWVLTVGLLAALVALAAGVSDGKFNVRLREGGNLGQSVSQPSGNDRVFYFAGPASFSSIPDLCDIAPTPQGPSSFCLRGDGGVVALQADGGATLAMGAVGAPQQVSVTQTPCGPDGCDVAAMRSEDGGYWVSPGATAIAGDFSYCVYVRAHAADGLGHTFIGQRSNGRPFSLYESDGVINAEIWGASGGQAYTSSVQGVQGSPQFLCFTYTRIGGAADNLADLYLDGVNVATNHTAKPSSGDSELMAVAATTLGATPANGMTHGAFLTQVALTSTQIQTMAQSLGVLASTTLAGSQGEAMTHTRASAATCADSASSQSVTVLPNGRPCVTGGGYLSEPAGTNLQIRSAALDNAEWSTAGTTSAAPTRTANAATAPDGTLTAETLAFPAVAATNNDMSIIYSAGATTTAAVYTGSIYLKKTAGAGTTLWLWFQQNGSEAVKGSAAECTVGATWTRCTVSATLAVATTRLILGCLVGTGCTSLTAVTVAATGAQTELGSVATSYIPTGATAATRAATKLIGPAQASLPVAQGTVQLDYKPLNSAFVATDFTLFDSISTTGIALKWATGDVLTMTADGAPISSAGLSWAGGTTYTVKAAWDGTNGCITRDGTSVKSAALTPPASHGAAMVIGTNQASNANAAGIISNLTVRNTGVCP